MELQRAYKVELDPNNAQRSAFAQHAGAARWAYNWGLQRKIEAYKSTKKSLSAMDLNKELVILKGIPKDDGGVPWMHEVSKCAPQEALRNLDRAFQGFFRNCKQKTGKKGFPRFKSRHKSPLKFKLFGCIRTDEKSCHVKLPNIGWVRLKQSEYLPSPEREDVKILSASLSERAGRWFVSLGCKVTIPGQILRPRAKVVGIDVGIKSLAVTSDGLVFENPRALAGCQRRLRRAQKARARKVKGSCNRLKARRRVARLHYRVSCIRLDSLHKATSKIIKDAVDTDTGMLSIENLNVSGMLKNHKIARSLSDASVSEFLRQLKYKASWAGIEVFKADRFFPSSKTCSSCGQVKQDLTLDARVFECDSCGLKLDRDLNAAINLKNLALSSRVAVCGEDVSPSRDASLLKATSVKQKPNRKSRDS